MKTMKKLTALMLSLVMMLALGVTAFATESSNGSTASTYTITAPNTDHKYEIYQIFTGDLDANKTLSNIKWGQNGTGTVGAKVDETVLNTIKNATGTDAEKLAVISQYANFNSVADGVVSNGSIYNAEPGYYLIKDENGSLANKDEAYTTYIVRVSENMTITPKTAKPTVDKQVWDEAGDAETVGENWGESADHAINESFQFKLKATLSADEDYAAYPTYKVVFNDTMSDGVTFESIESVTVDGVKVNVKAENTVGYTYTATPGQAGGSWSLTIDNIKNISGVNIVDGAVIEVIYNAHLNEKAKVNNASGDTTNQNRVDLQYSNNPNAGGNGELGRTPEDSVWVFTYEVDNTKVDGSVESKPALAGAGFKLYDSNGTNEIALIYDASISAYRPVKNGETGVEMKSANETGIFNIKGLDAGTYVLKETTTPSGYNTCDPVTVIISAEHAENAEGTGATTTLENTSTMNNRIENKKGSTLPSTGGMGTTIFYVVGTILVLAAVVLLITKKRMHVDK